MGETLPTRHEDHIAGKGDNALQHYNLFHKLFLCLKPWKFHQQKAAVDKEWKNWRKCRRGTWRKSEVRTRLPMKQGRRAQKFISPYWWTYVIWKMLNWRQSIQRSSCTPRGYCKKRFGVLCSIHWARIISITNDSSKSHGDHLQTASLCRTSTWRSICLNPGKMEDAPKLLKNPKSECPDIWIRLPRHKWLQSWSSMEDPFVPLERSLYGHPLAGLLWEGNFRKSYCSTVGRRFRIVNVNSYTVKKGCSYLCMWMTSN